MTYLQICQRFRQEAGIAGTGPDSVALQTGESKRIVDWVNSAYEDIQLERTNWFWMRDDFEFNTTIDQFEYTPLQAGITTRFSNWDVNTIKSFRTSIGVTNEFEIGELSYRRYRSIYLTGFQPSGTPIIFSISPSLNLLLGPKPDDVFTVSGQYWKTPQVLSVDGDVPEMPSQFHMLIVYKALEMYAYYESAPEVLARAQKYINRYKNRLEMNQLPDIELPEPLA